MNTTTPTGADLSTAESTIVLVDRPILALDQELREHLDGSRRLQIVTSPNTRATLPAHNLVTARRADWIIAADPYYEALTGRPVHWTGTTFAPDPAARTYAPAYTTPTESPQGIQLTLSFQATHSPNATLGSHLARLFQTVTGRPPLGWGPTEPLRHTWDPNHLTSHARTDREVTLFAKGAGSRPALSVSTFTTTATNTLEQTSLTVAHTMEDPPPLTHLNWLIETLATTNPINEFQAHVTPAPTDLTTEPRWTGPTTPITYATSTPHTPVPTHPHTHLPSLPTPLTIYTLEAGSQQDPWDALNTLKQHLQQRRHP